MHARVGGIRAGAAVEAGVLAPTEIGPGGRWRVWSSVPRLLGGKWSKELVTLGPRGPGVSPPF